MTIDDFTAVVAGYIHLNPNQRYGQALFNALHQERPDLSERIRATPLDPFYLDELISHTWDWILENW